MKLNTKTPHLESCAKNILHPILTYVVIYIFLLHMITYRSIKIEGQTGGPLVLNTMQQAVMSIVLLQQVAAQLKEPNFAEVIEKWDPVVTECVRKLLVDKENDKGEGGSDNSLYLLQLMPSQQLVLVLQSRETLEKLGITKWFVGEYIYIHDEMRNKLEIKKQGKKVH
jgi:hypothetical protein